MRQQTMRTIKHRPMADFKLRMSKVDPYHPVIGYYEDRGLDKGWRQLYETDCRMDLIVDCWEPLDDKTAERWSYVFANFDSLIELALHVIEPPIIAPHAFDIDDLIIGHVFINEPLEFNFTSDYCSEYCERPVVEISEGVARFLMWST
jgi:hypothetical protein